MLDDRSYMRGKSYGSRWSATLVLMVANTAIFVFQSILEFWFRDAFRWYFTHFALSLQGLAKGYIWQILTFQFMHGGLLHLICNLIAIYFFGRAMEDALGRSGFWKLYFASGILGGLLQIVFAGLFPSLYGGSVVGASAGAFGLVAAFATMFPNQLLTLLLFFVIPVSMRARTLLWISLAFAIFGIIVPMGNVAEAAHLGGILTGVAFVKLGAQDWFFHWPGIPWPRRKPRRLTKSLNAGRSFWQQHKPLEDAELESAEFISREVDPILDKISAHGIHSLTERERRILEAARARMAKR